MKIIDCGKHRHRKVPVRKLISVGGALSLLLAAQMSSVRYPHYAVWWVWAGYIAGMWYQSGVEAVRCDDSCGGKKQSGLTSH